MRALRELVAAHPWPSVTGAFLAGALLALDRGTRRVVALTVLELVRRHAALYAADVARAWLDRDGRPYARA